MRYITNKDRFKHALEVYCRLKPTDTFGEFICSKILGFLLRRGAKIFDVEEKDIIETFKNPEYVRGLNLVMKSIATYGITKPQKLIAPFIVVWDYTSMCNLRCKHCYANAGKLPKDELTTEERYKVIDKLDKAGVVLVAFSGGEPLMRKDFFEIARYAREKGMFVSVASNGTLITRKVAERMKEIGVGYVEISLDHIDPKIAISFISELNPGPKILDFIGKRITPEQAITAVKKAKKYGPNALGSLVIGFPEETKEEIEKTIKFSKKVGVEFAQFTIATPYPGTRLRNYALSKNLILTFNWRKYPIF